jgi:hypothetical protein
MMSQLHWTGAAILLGMAVLSDGAARPRRHTILGLADLDRQRVLAPEPRQPAPAAAPRAVQSAEDTHSAPNPLWQEREQHPQRSRHRAPATCGHCSRTVGDLEWDAAVPWAGVVLRPAAGGGSQPVPSGTRLRCGHCGGPVFAECPELVFEHPSVVAAPTRRGRPRRTPTCQAS